MAEGWGMLRVGLLRVRWLVRLVVAWGIAWGAVPHLAEAAPIPPRLAGASTPDLEGIRSGLEEKLVRARLSALGVSPAEAAAALDRLTPDERSELAARAEELGAGGNVAAVLAVAIIVTLLTVLILELMGRRVISRP
jgi:hypothetical protein